MDFNEWSQLNPDKSLNDYYAWKRNVGGGVKTEPQTHMRRELSRSEQTLQDYSWWIVFGLLFLFMFITNPDVSQHVSGAREEVAESAKTAVGDMGFFNGLKNGVIDFASTSVSVTGYENWVVFSKSRATVMGIESGTCYGLFNNVWIVWD